MKMAQKKIWIDFDNSPHVVFFRPIIDELHKRGYAVVLTVRDCCQTVELADMHGMQYVKAGKHLGKNKIMKVLGLFTRALQMAPFVLAQRPDLALSHGSRSQLLTAKILGVNSLMLFDYEFARSVPISRPKHYMAPEVVMNSAPAFMKGKLLSYPGIKEDVYVPFFSPDNGLRAQLGFDDKTIMVTIRPPASEAHYHNPESEPIFEAIIEMIAARKDAAAVILPRSDNQKRSILEKWPALFKSKKIQIPAQVVDGLNLIWFSDVVISGGGTMNREAAALNVPVYSIFRGKLGAIDRYLSEQGRLSLITCVGDIKKIKFVRREPPKTIGNRDLAALDAIVNCIVRIVEKR
jgi:uncharacterized protein